VLGAFALFTMFAGLVPLAVVWLERRRGFAPRVWLITAAFGVSCVSDFTVLYSAPPWLVSAVYPVVQYGLLYLALAPRLTAISLLLLTGGLAGIAIRYGAWERPDALPRVAGSLAVIALSRMPGLWVYFGLGTVGWVWYCATPDLWPWLAYQACRLVGLTLFTVAVWRDH
jgi:hypothetical protein